MKSFMVAGFLGSLLLLQAPLTAQTPRSLSADQMAATIRALPEYAHFSLSGVSFFKGRVYVSSNVGLLVINGARIEKLNQWSAQDAVVEGPWLDMANEALWIQLARDGSLSKFDGTVWQPVRLPVPPAGYTRGDVLAGFLGVGAPTAFWIVGGGHVWRFQPKGNSWVPEPQPPAPQYSAVRAVALLNNSLLYITREGSEIVPPSAYAAYNRGSNWSRQKLSEKMDLGDVVTTAEGIYVRAKDGALFLIDSGSVRRVETPSRCEAIAQTLSGKLLASFVDRGIFLLENRNWVLKAPYPYGKEEGEHWAHLAESNGEIAYVTSSVPQIAGNDEITYSGSVAVWVLRGGKLERIPIR